MIVSLSAPISGSTEAAFVVKRSSTQIATIQALPGSPTNFALYLTSSAATASNYTLVGGSNSVINCPSGGNVDLNVNGTTIVAVSSSAVAISSNQLAFSAAQTSPTISQYQAGGTGSAAGAAMSLSAQQGQANTASGGTAGNGANLTNSGGAGGNATGGGASVGGNGGNLILNGAAGGTGTTAGATGSVQISLAGTVLAQWTPNGPIETPYAWSMGITTGTATLTSAQYIYPVISVATATLTGALTIVFPSTVGGIWSLDLSKVTFSSYAITVKCGTGAAATTITSSSVKTLWTVVCPAANVCVIG